MRVIWMIFLTGFFVLTPVTGSTKGNPNLLIKASALPSESGLVLVSFGYSDIAASSEPCLQVELRAIPDPKKNKVKRVYLNTTTGWRCNAAWTDPSAVRKENGGMQVLILLAVPAGEYEVTDSFAQYERFPIMYTANPSVLGVRRINVRSGEITYAGLCNLRVHSGGGLSFEISDNSQIDIELFKKLRPDLQSLAITSVDWN